jgi:hypothetical protein
VALTDKMAASKQSRRPAQATPLPPAIALARSLPAGAVLYIRLWGGEETHILPSPASESPGLPLCLTMDMIAACGGSISETHGQVLVARFSSFQDGVLAARRLQWAAQGLLETPTFHSTGVAVLVHSPEDALDPKAKDASFYALSQGSAGQILFTHGAAGYAESLPGYVFGAGADGALRELQWGGSGGQQTRSKDDDTIAGLIEKKGPEAKAKAYPVQADVSSFNVSGNVHPTPSASGQAEKETGQSSTRQSGQRRVKLLWIGGVASAAILLLVAFLVLRSFVQSTHSASVPVASAPAASVPAASLPAAQPAGGAVITAPPAAQRTPFKARHRPPRSNQILRWLPSRNTNRRRIRRIQRTSLTSLRRRRTTHWPKVNKARARQRKSRQEIRLAGVVILSKVKSTRNWWRRNPDRRAGSTRTLKGNLSLCWRASQETLVPSRASERFVRLNC